MKGKEAWKENLMVLWLLILLVILHLGKLNDHEISTCNSLTRADRGVITTLMSLQLVAMGWGHITYFVLFGW